MKNLFKKLLKKFSKKERLLILLLNPKNHLKVIHFQAHFNFRTIISQIYSTIKFSKIRKQRKPPNNRLLPAKNPNNCLKVLNSTLFFQTKMLLVFKIKSSLKTMMIRRMMKNHNNHCSQMISLQTCLKLTTNHFSIKLLIMDKMKMMTMLKKRLRLINLKK